MQSLVMASGKFWSVLVLVSLLTVPAARAGAEQDSAKFVGLWQGAILFQKGAVEGDMVLELMANPEGKLLGLCALPIQGIEDHPVVDIKPQGSHLSFVYNDDTGSSLVNLSLSKDGKHLEGEMVEKEKRYPIVFKRTTREEMAPSGALQILSRDAHELHQRFDKDAGKVRLLILLSPSCHTCMHMARMIQRYLMEEISDPRIAVYVVWGPMLEGDTPELARKAMAHLPDSRAVHFWTPSADLAEAFSRPLNTQPPAWDVIFFFAPGSVWTVPPKPVDYAHLWGKQLPLDHQFNGTELAGKVRKLLAAK
jgi:hypothetical protein